MKQNVNTCSPSHMLLKFGGGTKKVFDRDYFFFVLLFGSKFITFATTATLLSI